MTRKQRLTLSFYAYAHPRPWFRNDLFLAEPTWGTRPHLCSQWGINAQLSLPADNFYKDSIEVYAFMKGIRLNIAIARRSFLLKLTIKVRDKIVADGLVDKTLM
jgi:UPF0176 protein